MCAIIFPPGFRTGSDPRELTEDECHKAGFGIPKWSPHWTVGTGEHAPPRAPVQTAAQQRAAEKAATAAARAARTTPHFTPGPSGYFEPGVMNAL